MSLAATVAAAASALESGLLSDTCVLTPVNADGSDGTPVTVRCAIVQPAAQSGPYGGGGNQISRPGDVTIMLPRGTTITSGYRVFASGSARTFSAGFVVKPQSHDPLLFVQGVEIAS